MRLSTYSYPPIYFLRLYYTLIPSILENPDRSIEEKRWPGGCQAISIHCSNLCIIPICIQKRCDNSEQDAATSCSSESKEVLAARACLGSAYKSIHGHSDQQDSTLNHFRHIRPLI